MRQIGFNIDRNPVKRHPAAQFDANRGDFVFGGRAIWPCAIWALHPDTHTPCAPLDLAAIGELTFRAPDEDRFPATRLARAAAEAGGATPAVLNAGNEIAVAAFLAGKLPFTRIAVMVEQVLARYAPSAPASLDEVMAVDDQARVVARGLLELV